MSDAPNARLTPDEVTEILRRAGKSERATIRLTVAEVAERAGWTEAQVRTTLRSLRALGETIDLPSGELSDLRAAREDEQRDEEDPRARYAVGSQNDGLGVEIGAGRLPRGARWVLLVGAFVFFVLLVATAYYMGRSGSPTRP